MIADCGITTKRSGSGFGGQARACLPQRNYTSPAAAGVRTSAVNNLTVRRKAALVSRPVQRHSRPFIACAAAANAAAVLCSSAALF